MSAWLLLEPQKELYTKFLDNIIDLEYIRIEYYKYINK